MTIPTSEPLIEALRVPRELLLEFFVTFARFEHTLKAVGFVRDSGGAAEADWNSFMNYLERLRGADVAPILYAAQSLLNPPPRRLVIREGALEWEEVRRGRQSEIRFVIEAVKRARNNLFHGGKFLTSPEPRDRNEQVVAAGLSVLTALLNAPWAFRLRQAFDEIPQQ